MDRTRRTTFGVVVLIGAASLTAAGCGGKGREASASDGAANGAGTASGEVAQPIPAESTTQAMVAAPATAREATPGGSAAAAGGTTTGARGDSAARAPAALQPAGETGAKSAVARQSVAGRAAPSQSGASQGGRTGAPATPPAHPAAADSGSAGGATATAQGAASGAQGGEVRVNKFMSYDPTAKTVSLSITAALTNAQGGFNFNGGSNGNQTITVPQGWTVRMDVKNVDAIPHSAIVIDDVKPLPNAPETPAIPRAYSAHVTDGLAPVNGEDLTTFRAPKAGSYLIYCGVPGHGPSGMYIKFVVSADATKPSYSM